MKYKTLFEEGLPYSLYHEPDFKESVEWHRRWGNLEGSPQKVEGYLWADGLELESLVGGPIEVGCSYNVSGNNLKTLDGVARVIGGSLNVKNNRIESLVGVDELIDSIRFSIYLSQNPVTRGGVGLLLIDGLQNIEAKDCSQSFMKAINIISKYLGKGESGIYECQKELIEAGLEEFAEL